MFLKGLRDGGVPIKFSSWHTFIFSSSSSQNFQFLIQERSRSVKALFALQRRAQADIGKDNGAMFFDTGNPSSSQSTLQTFQFRVGGRYFPAAPVQCSSNVGSKYSNGAAEAYVELEKALNIVGDYRISSNCNASRWGLSVDSAGLNSEFDYTYTVSAFANSQPTFTAVEAATSSFCGDLGSACFAMATNLETSNGVEISGLNAEEQSDIALLANYYGPQVQGGDAKATNIEVYSYYDAMIILRENNVLELIQ
jgi:hypothetical protein